MNFYPSNAFSILVSVSNEDFFTFQYFRNVLLTTIHPFSQLLLGYFHLLHFIKHLHSYFLRKSSSFIIFNSYYETQQEFVRFYF